MRWRSYNRESAPPVAAWMAMALLALAGCHGNVQPAEGLEEIRQERQPPHLQPVSYTHLDVYKRQLLLSLAGGRSERAGDGQGTRGARRIVPERSR